jgi:hypothetical protein
MKNIYSVNGENEWIALITFEYLSKRGALPWENEWIQVHFKTTGKK